MFSNAITYCGISSLHKNIVFRSNKKQTVILPKTTNSLSRRLRPIHANNLEMRYVFYIGDLCWRGAWYKTFSLYTMVFCYQSCSDLL